MIPKQTIDQERLGELRSILGSLPGASAKDWRLEFYDLIDGRECLTQIIDVKTGEEVEATKPKKNKVTPYRNRSRKDE